MMTEMTRYKQQNNIEDDCSSLESARTEDLGTGTTRIRYHMGGGSFWRSRSKLEKILLVSLGICLLVAVILVGVLHSQFLFCHSSVSKAPPVIMVHNHDTILGPCLTEDCVMIAGNILERMNLDTDPCEDFYQFACGSWIASSVKPEGKPAWGTLSKRASDNQVIIRIALESTEPSKSEAEEKAKIFYRSCVDKNDTIEKRGGQPLFELLKDSGGWSLYGNWTPEDYDLQADIIQSKIEYSSGALFTWGVAEDDKNSDRYILEFDQGGLHLPARDYYLNQSEKAVAEAYVKYITKIGVLLGADEDQSREVAQDILEFETSLANFSQPDDLRRDDEKLYHNMKLESLSKLAPFMDWTVFVNAAFQKVNRHTNKFEEVVVYAPGYLANVTDFLHSKMTTDEGKTSIHNYLTWHVIKNYMGYLSRDFREAYNILEKAQVGVAGGEEEWRECVTATDVAFGPAVGAMYIRKAFSKDAKSMAKEMLSSIRRSFRDNLNQVQWMDPKTKKLALEKADHISQMIGFPEYILNANELNKKLDELLVSEDKFFENNKNVTLFKARENLNRLSGPVNKTRWDMTPPTVNAYYSPTRNSIVFPAGILQPPLFDKNNPKALNYGAVGVVMGHELSHAFDDQGRKYDKDGNLHSWWEPSTSANFNAKTECMVAQYSNYTLRKEHLKGKLTLGENIADNGGLKVSYEAYHKTYPHDFVLPGLKLTSDQLFFLGFAQVWCSTMTKEVAHLEILRDSHVLPQFRVKGTLSNSLEFSKAYKCPLESPMNPKKKCVVW